MPIILDFHVTLPVADTYCWLSPSWALVNRCETNHVYSEAWFLHVPAHGTSSVTSNAEARHTQMKMPLAGASPERSEECRGQGSTLTFRQ